MLVLLVYSLRKRWSWLSFLGSTPGWFRFHMVLGIADPCASCITRISAPAQPTATWRCFRCSPLPVAASSAATSTRTSTTGCTAANSNWGIARGRRRLAQPVRRISFLPELVARIDTAEQRLLKAGPHLSFLGFAKPMVVGTLALKTRWELHHYIRHSLHAGARRSAVVALEHKRLGLTARAYIDRRLAATRRVASFEGYERLFSLWHALHIPLIFMMVIAAVIHVIAVHVY